MIGGAGRGEKATAKGARHAEARHAGGDAWIQESIGEFNQSWIKDMPGIWHDFNLGRLTDGKSSAAPNYSFEKPQMHRNG
jgi:hypothetical protein